MSKGPLTIVRYIPCIALLALAAARPAFAAAADSGMGQRAAAAGPRNAGPVRSGAPRQTPPQTFTCPTNDMVVCLLSDRFEVTAQFAAANGQSGGAHMVKLTDDSAYMWFFSSDNVEVVLKVLDACPLNNEYWIFAGGLTNVAVMITVTDSSSGKFARYNNPQGTAFQPIQDTSALPVCP